MRRTVPAFLSFLLLSIFPAYSFAQQEASTAWKNHADRLFDAGVVAWTNDAPGTALRLLLMSYDLQPSSTVASTISKVLPEQESTPRIEWMQRALSLDPDHYENTLDLFLLYVRSNFRDRALTLMKEYLKRNPDKEEGYFFLASVTAEMGDFPEAVRILENLIAETSDPNIRRASEQLLLQVLLATGNIAGASAQIASSIAPDEHDEEKVLEGVEKLIAIGAYQEAIKAISPLAEASAYNPRIIATKALLHARIGERDKAAAEGKRLLAISSMLPEEKISALLDIMRSDPQMNDHISTYLPLLEQLAVDNSTSLEAQQLYITFLSPEKDQERYLKQLNRMVNDFPGERDFPVALMAYYISERDYASGDSLWTKLQNRDPKNPGLYSIQGASLSMRERKDEALELLLRGIDSIPPLEKSEGLRESDKRAICTLYGSLGDLYHELGKDEEAFKAYDKGLEYYGESPEVLNNYAYYLALQKKDLSKAIDMAAKAISIAPESATILDTYAYVLLLHGDYIMAEIYIRQAIDIEPQKASLYDRYAEILLQQKKILEALEQLKNAENLEPSEERRAQIESLSKLNTGQK